MRKKYLDLFLTLLKIGLFTFGGGYAMIALLEREFVEKKKWIEQDEFLNVVAIAESTPGPIAINSATYIGYKVGKIKGAVIGSVAVCIPSFLIIYIISLFFDAFLSAEYVSYAFKGIQVCVAYLILSAGVKMFMKMKKTPFAVILFSLAVTSFVLTTLFAVNISSILFILSGAFIGVTVYLVKRIAMNEKREGKK